jgi:hypothetical protein
MCTAGRSFDRVFRRFWQIAGAVDVAALGIYIADFTELVSNR